MENKVGRPRIYQTPAEMEEIIEAYFKESEDTNTPITITGLILYLGFAHREALHDYEKREGFSDIVKKARIRVENAYEQKLHGNSPTGSIFALKNMGWKDKTEQEISGSLNTTGVDLSKLSDEALKQLRDAQSANA